MEAAAPASAIPVIIDMGSGTTKAGLGGETMPRAVFPTLFGKPRVSGGGISIMSAKSEYVGDEALTKKGVLKLDFPVENGIVRNWDAVTTIYTHTMYNELRVSPEEHPILLTDSDRDPKVNKEKLAQLFFEKFKVPSLFIVNPAILSLYANAVVTGTAVDIGDCLTLCVPAFEGMGDTKAMKKRCFGGRQLTALLVSLLNEKDNLFQSSAEQYIVKGLKEEACIVVLDHKEALAAPKGTYDKAYSLPDGKKLVLGKERFECPEYIFDPQAGAGKTEEGLHQFIMSSLNSCDPSLKPALLSNIVLAGGSSMFPGLPERLSKELNAILPEGVKAEVKAMKNRKYSGWIGGSLISSLSTFSNMWLSLKEYQETGPDSIAKKFPV